MDAIDAADELADALTRALVVATRLVHDHDAAQFILQHEPELFLPFLGFHQVDLVYRETSAVIGPHLARFVPAHRAAWAAEWAARLFITYLFNPDPHRDLAVIRDARDLVDRFLIPALAISTPVPSST